MKRLLKAEFFKLSKEWTLWLLMLFSIVDGYLDGIVPVRYDVVITGYEMYVMRLLAGLRYEVLIGVFAVSFVYSEYKNHTLIHSIYSGFRRSQIFLAKAAAFFAGVLPIVLLHICVGVLLCRQQCAVGNPAYKELHRSIWAGPLYSVSDTDTCRERTRSPLVWQYCRPSGGGSAVV